MKLTTFLLTIACLGAAAGGTAQTIKLDVKDAPLERVFAQIKKQSDYSFVYYKDDLAKGAKITLRLTSADIEEVLQQVLKNQPLSYKIVDHTIVIAKKEDKSRTTLHEVEGLTNAPPPIDVKGRILNENGEPVLASIVVKGANKGTTSNADGYFELKGVDEDATLVITAANIETREIKLNGRSDLGVVVVKMSVESLNEVVINKGYYTEKQRLSTGNVTKVTSSEIEKQPVSNVLLALQGRVPGMIITQTTGVAGGAVKVQIRGQNSIAQGNDPLYVVDGVPFGALPNLTLQGLGSNILGDAGRINPLNYLNPSDVLSIEVLKDADATAIYGSRGSNGVILITTKKGEAGKMNIDLTAQTGFGKVTRRANLMNTEQYLEMRNEAFKNSGTTPSATDYDVNAKWSKTDYTDWQDVFIGGTSHYNDYQLSISGGTDLIRYRIGSGYHRETTVFPMPKDFNDQKSSVDFSIKTTSINRRFNVLFSGSYMSDRNKLPSSDFTKDIIIAPNAPSLYNSDGSLNWTDFSDNPFREKYRSYTLKSKNAIGNAVLKYQILKNLDLITNFGYSNTVFDENEATPLAYYPPTAPLRYARFNDYTTSNWLVEPQMSYSETWGKANLGILVGGTLQKRLSEGQAVNGSDYADDALLGSLAGAVSITKGAATYEEYKYNSLFGRLKFDWNQTYLLNFTARRDGSSRFGPGKQFGNFGAIGVGWIFSSESFIQHSLPFLSFGKFRASYGLVGNEPAASYKYLELFSFTGNNPYQGGAGVVPNNLPAPGYSWEENRKLEIGLESALFHDRISMSMSYYRNRSGNQLVQSSLPSTTGFYSIAANLPALVQNKGWEFTLRSINIKTQKLTWSTGLNFSIVRNKLLEFPNLENNPSYKNVLVVGEPTTISKSFKYAGIDPQTGTYQFYDSKAALTSTPDFSQDLLVYINPVPTSYGGLQNSFEYQNFHLDVFFQFVKTLGRNYLFNINYAPGQFVVGRGNQPVEVLDRWRMSGDAAAYQMYLPGSNNSYSNYAKASDVAYSDATFIRLKNVSLSYQAPAHWIKPVGLSSLRFFVLAQNLLTITNYKGADPENQSVTSLPPLRNITAGIQLSFK